MPLREGNSTNQSPNQVSHLTHPYPEHKKPGTSSYFILYPLSFILYPLTFLLSLCYYVKKNSVLNKKIDLLVQRLKDQLGLFLSIGFGIFLFVLFFQPFPLIVSDLNNVLLLIAGLAAIIFVLMVLIRVLLPWLLVLDDPQNKEPPFPSYFNGFIIFVLSSVAFIFYIRYVGSVGITFFITFKVMIICLVPPVVLGLYDTYNELNSYNDLLIADKKIIQKKIEKFEEDILNKSIEFVSENISENFSLLIGEVTLLKSADNYVEIVYKEGESF